MLRIITVILVFKTVLCSVHDNSVNDCNLPAKLVEEISNYAPIVEKIVNSVKTDFKKVTYNELAAFIDQFGNRKTGTENLENAIDYMIKLSKSRGLENVHGEPVQVPYWQRGKESATLVGLKNVSLQLLGLGSSIGTPEEGILAEVLVVKSFKELQTRSDSVRGKIVVFNPNYVSYGKTVQYRSKGASQAVKFGAVATLVRSVTDFSLNTPHTGWQSYDDGVKKIPTACITVEDANMLERMQNRGEKLKILLKLEDRSMGVKISRNTIAEIRGSTSPEKVVIVSGHLDSWDVGKGAMDDGGGVFISWGSLVLLKSLGLRPKRTIRAIFWTGEEEGLIGVQAYDKAHKKETKNFNFVMESDIGTFNPLGLEFSAGHEGGCILEEVMKLLSILNTTQLRRSSDVGSDIMVWIQRGIPGASLLNQNEKYFWYHHSAADTMDAEDPDALDKSTALWASVAYILADLSVDFPRDLNFQSLLSNNIFKLSY